MDEYALTLLHGVLPTSDQFHRFARINTTYQIETTDDKEWRCISDALDDMAVAAFINEIKMRAIILDKHSLFVFLVNLVELDGSDVALDWANRILETVGIEWI